AAPRDLNRFDLVGVQGHRLPIGIFSALNPENVRTFGVKKSRCDQFMDRTTGDKAGINLDHRCWPETTAFIRPVHVLFDILCPDFRETPRKTLIVRDQLVAKAEHVQGPSHLARTACSNRDVPSETSGTDGEGAYWLSLSFDRLQSNPLSPRG